MAIDAIVIHADAGKSDAGTISWIVDPASKVSYHYLICRDRRVVQFVPDAKKAWHAGKSEFLGRPDCNLYSLGVAFANNQTGEQFKVEQIEVGAQLVAQLCTTHCIPLPRITTHAIVSPGRKHDPGPLFNWAAFHARVTDLLAAGVSAP